ncbi:MAG: transporter, ATP-binding protein [Francisellaceae bacterium]|nr:transporter, ATP-binding protein [Francisellaceae bacterium]
MKKLLSINHLSKSYKKRVIVKNVSLKIESGEIIGLLGPNGAGKTTCFYMIIGLIPADSGSITLNHQNITHMAVHHRSRLGISYLPQEASIFRKLSVSQNILSILETRTDLSQTEQMQELTKLLQDFNLNHVKDTLGISLSGGERRRAEIARCLATKPQFIFLDEPFAGVDPLSLMDIKKIIKALSQRNIGVIITDHNVRETLDICHRAYIINAGSVICQGTPQHILDDKVVREVYLGEEFKV